MENIRLKAESREDLGKGGSRHIRRAGLVPGVIYKGGKIGLNIQVDGKELWRALHTEAGENAIITMDISGKTKNDEKTVILQEIQTDPLNDKFLHVDFHEISLKEKIKVKVPVALKGEAVGVTDEHGVLTQNMWELEVECLPTAIPEHVYIHVDNLHINDVIHVKDVELPEGVVVLEEPDQTVVSVNTPRAEVSEEEEPAGEGAEEPELIKKGKKEEEEATEE
ncbi:MAG: 50S ribosomal protein L25 [Candidatus Omnitrophota bacterium]